MRVSLVIVCPGCCTCSVPDDPRTWNCEHQGNEPCKPCEAAYWERYWEYVRAEARAEWQEEVAASASWNG